MEAFGSAAHSPFSDMESISTDGMAAFMHNLAPPPLGTSQQLGLDPGICVQAAAALNPTGRMNCQAADCTIDLRTTKPYCMKKRLCPNHLTAQAVRRRGGGNGLWRFCQQCGKLEPIEAFDDVKRSCRARLQKRRAHNNMRNTMEYGSCSRPQTRSGDQKRQRQGVGTARKQSRSSYATDDDETGDEGDEGCFQDEDMFGAGSAGGGLPSDADMESHSSLLGGLSAADADGLAGFGGLSGLAGVGEFQQQQQQQHMFQNMLYAPNAGIVSSSNQLGASGTQLQAMSDAFAAAGAPAAAAAPVHDTLLGSGSGVADGAASSDWILGDLGLLDDLWSGIPAAGADAAGASAMPATTSAAAAAALAAAYADLDQQGSQQLQQHLAGDMQHLLAGGGSCSLAQQPSVLLSGPSGPFQQQHLGQQQQLQSPVVSLPQMQLPCAAAPAAPAAGGGGGGGASSGAARHSRLVQLVDDLLADMMPQADAAVMQAALEQKQKQQQAKQQQQQRSGVSDDRRYSSAVSPGQDSITGSGLSAGGVFTGASPAAAAAAVGTPGLAGASPACSAPSDSLTHMSEAAFEHGNDACAPTNLSGLLSNPKGFVEMALQEALHNSGLLGKAAGGLTAAAAAAGAAAGPAPNMLGSLLGSLGGLGSVLGGAAGGFSSNLLSNVFAQSPAAAATLLMAQHQQMEQLRAGQQQLLQQLPQQQHARQLQAQLQPLSALLGLSTAAGGDRQLRGSSGLSQLRGLEQLLLPPLQPQQQQQPAAGAEVVEVVSAQLQAMKDQIAGALAAPIQSMQSQMSEIKAELQRLKANGSSGADAGAGPGMFQYQQQVGPAVTLPYQQLMA